jgi:hypothetical protein
MASEYDEQLAHLRGLAGELRGLDFRAELRDTDTSPYLKAINRGGATLNERVLCERAPDRSWHFLWPWKQPIGGVDDVAGVARKIADVLRSVETAP